MRKLCPLLLVLAGLLWSPAPASAIGLPSDWEKGFDFTAWWENGYSTTSAATSMDNLATTGANSIAIFTTWYQASTTATALAPDPQRTPTDDSVATAVRLAKAKGLRVMLRPSAASSSGGWSGDFAPSSVSAWFESYRTMVNHYADLARALGADSLSIGTEMQSLTKPAYDSSWRSIIAGARARFSGTLTYSANHSEYAQINWWDALDRIGIDAYFPLATGATPSEDQVVAAWNDFTDSWGGRHHYIDEIAAVQARFGKPVIFTEIGYGSRLNTLVDPWNPSGTYSAVDQQVALRAAFRAFAGKPWFKGMYIWHWFAQDPTAQSLGSTDHTPQNKPAQSTITEWFKAPDPNQAPAPSPPVNAAPTVRIVSPVAGQLFNDRLALQASASDDKGVARVEFRVDGQVVQTDYTAPYAHTWKVPKKLSYGTHTVTAKAYDAGGLSASATVTVTRSRTGA